jgi:hypothetical protein
MGKYADYTYNSDLRKNGILIISVQKKRNYYFLLRI